MARTGQCADRPVLAQFSPRFSPSSRHIFAREVPKVNKLSKKELSLNFFNLIDFAFPWEICGENWVRTVESTVRELGELRITSSRHIFAKGIINLGICTHMYGDGRRATRDSPGECHLYRDNIVNHMDDTERRQRSLPPLVPGPYRERTHVYVRALQTRPSSR